MTRQYIFILVLILSAGALAIFTVIPARAAPTAPTFTVNSPADVVASAPLDNGVCETAPGNGVCTLRAAIMKANHYPGVGATINFGLPGTITYTLAIVPSDMDDESTGDLNITNTLTIIGNGASNTIIDGNTIDRVFIIGTGVTVTISGVTIQDGKPSGLGGSYGGGIVNNGILTLTHSAISRNSANSTSGGSSGGGIGNNSILTLIHSTVSQNSANSSLNTSSGGGIYSGFPLSLTIINSTIIGNSANSASGIAGGGGIIGSGTLINSTVSGNTTSGAGGGINAAGPLILVNSTISGNMAGEDGGGILISGPLTLTNSTVSSNKSNANGGGIYIFSHTTSLFNVTISGNLANADASGGGAGGGVFDTTNSTVNFQNSIIGGNNTINPDGILLSNDCSGTLTSQGNNIVSSDLGCTVSGGGVTFTDPMLSPLANNGGPTQTHALLPGSPAIDAGNVGGCTDNLGAFLTRDQRGYPRPAFGKTSFRCDIGAFELQQLLYLPLIVR